MPVNFKDKSASDAPAKGSKGSTKKVPLQMTPEMTDRLAELLAWEKTFKQDERAKELEALKKMAAAEADAVGNLAAVHVFEGVKYEVEFSSKPEQTVIVEGGVEAIHKMLGKDFYAVATVSTTNLKEYLNPKQREQVTKTERTGTRRCTEFRERNVVAGSKGAAPLADDADL